MTKQKRYIGVLLICVLYSVVLLLYTINKSYQDSLNVFYELIKRPEKRPCKYLGPFDNLENWNEFRNRDMNIYVQPNITTTIYEPADVCKQIKNKLLLLMIVPSSVDHFEKRKVIRDTWANYDEYRRTSKIYNYVTTKDINTNTTVLNITKDPEYDVLKMTYCFDNGTEMEDIDEDKRDFRVLFFMGLPKDNQYSLQNSIDKEVETYEDVIQEDFVDSYRNLSLKSTMMLKWFVNKCGERVRYIFKIDDDMFVNTANLITSLRERAKTFDEKAKNGQKEFVIMGHRLYGGKPDLNPYSLKYYVPKFTYSGTIWPRYLSGTGYVLSSSAAAALYATALKTPFMNLEDVYITGLVRLRAEPRIRLTNDFKYLENGVNNIFLSCSWYWRITAYVSSSDGFRILHKRSKDVHEMERCEKLCRMKDPPC